MDKKPTNFKERLNKVLLFDSRNTIAFMGFSIFATIIGILSFLSSFFLIGVVSKTRTIYVAVIAPLIFTLILALLLFVRFYKKSQIIKTTNRYLLVNQILTYIYLTLILAWVVVVMLQRKYYGVKDVDLSLNMGAFVKFRYTIYVISTLIIGLTFAQFFYNLYIYLRKNTKEDFETIKNQEIEKVIADEKLGELVSNPKEEIKEEQRTEQTEENNK